MEMRPQLVVALAVEALDSRLFDGAVHPLDLSIGPGVVRPLDCARESFGEPVLDVVCFAYHVEAHLTRPGGVAVARLVGELDASLRIDPPDQSVAVGIAQDHMDPVGYRFQQMFEELPRRSPVSLVDELGDHKLAGAVDADEQVELALSSLHLGDIDVKEADRVALEALSLGPFDFAQESLVAFDVRQTGDAVALQTAV